MAFVQRRYWGSGSQMGYSPIGCRSLNRDKGFQSGRISNSFFLFVCYLLFSFSLLVAVVFIWEPRYLKLCSEFPIYVFSVIVSTIPMIIICLSSSPTVHHVYLCTEWMSLWWSCCLWKMYGVKSKVGLV